MEKNKILVQRAAIIGSGTDDLTNMFLSLSLSSIIVDLGISNTQAGSISTITNFGMLLGGLIFGYLADKYGTLKLFKITLLLFSLATASMFFATNMTTIYVLRFLAGIGTGGEYGIAISLLAKVTPASKMGKMSAYNGVAGMVGNIFAALLASIILPTLGWNYLFLLGLLPLLIVAWVHFNVTDDVLEKSLESHGTVEKTEKPSYGELFKTPKLARQTVSLMFMAIVQIGGYFGLMNWLPQIMQQSLGLSVSGSSLWMISTILGMSLGMLFFGRILDNFGPRFSYGLFLLASASAVFLFTLVKNEFAMLLGGALVGFFVNGMFAGYGAIVSKLYPRHVHSMANNLVINVGRAIGGFSSIIIGFLMDVGNVTTVMTYLSFSYLASFVVMMTIKEFAKTRYHQTPENVKI
ncbi:MFS transporter [Jeotgalibaca sp. A122]|uniref:MFS transporter n=1 Tax=Jeotgalibaca sp. A122 TaxID=3457322 RepID=UPI003FD368B1